MARPHAVSTVGTAARRALTMPTVMPLVVMKIWRLTRVG